jgi:hypothetical protein
MELAPAQQTRQEPLVATLRSAFTLSGVARVLVLRNQGELFLAERLPRTLFLSDWKPYL